MHRLAFRTYATQPRHYACYEARGNNGKNETTGTDDLDIVPGRMALTIVAEMLCSFITRQF